MGCGASAAHRSLDEPSTGSYDCNFQSSTLGAQCGTERTTAELSQQLLPLRSLLRGQQPKELAAESAQQAEPQPESQPELQQSNKPALLLPGITPHRLPDQPAPVAVTLPGLAKGVEKINVAPPAASDALAPLLFNRAEDGDDFPRNPDALVGEDYKLAIAFLSTVPVFRDMPKAEMPILVQAMTRIDYEPCETVIQQGEVSDQFCIILSGQAEVVRSEGDSERLLVNLSKGDYFGEQELVHAKEARASVRCIGVRNLVTFSICHDHFWTLGLEQWLRIPQRRAVVDVRAARRRGSSRTDVPDVLITQSEKSAAQRAIISDALRANAYLPSFCDLTDAIIDELIITAARKTFLAGERLMSQGDLHHGWFYIVESGSFRVCGRGNRGAFRELSGIWEAVMSPGCSFGELELLYSAPCMASVTAVEDSAVWVINQLEFLTALRSAVDSRVAAFAGILRTIELFSGLYNEELTALAQAVTEVTYCCDEEIVVQGEDGHTFFVLVDGELSVIRDGAEVDRRKTVRSHGSADFFGEEELLRPGPRIATVKVVSESAILFAIDKVTFDSVLEPLDSLVRAISEKGDARSPCQTDKAQGGADGVKWWTLEKRSSQPGVHRSDLELSSQLGSGAFGTVDLAVDKRTASRYALKRLSKADVVGKYARNQLVAEKTIMNMTSSQFIVRLYATFQDSKYYAFLMELVPRGDLYHAFCRYQLFGDEPCAQFYAAGVILALGHLHERRVLHRDLKPENVLLDEAAWPKLADFGLAKFSVGKTFTLCGTLPYMAPEVVLQAGHDRGCDWWSFGVFVYEMMAGCTPFETADDDDTNMIKGIKRGIVRQDLWQWPDGFSDALQSLISVLLRRRVSDRLPMKPGGAGSLAAHAWFADFDWQSFEARTLRMPSAKLEAPWELTTKPCAEPWELEDFEPSIADVDF